jgi:hypothetical protein
MPSPSDLENSSVPTASTEIDTESLSVPAANSCAALGEAEDTMIPMDLNLTQGLVKELMNPNDRDDIIFAVEKNSQPIDNDEVAAAMLAALGGL